MARPIPPTDPSEKRDWNHDVKNRIHAILLGVNLLERASDEQLREVASEVREEVELLRRLLEELNDDAVH